MQMALDEAHIAAQAGEVPVGAVLVGQDGNILAQTRNQMRALMTRLRMRKFSPFAKHAKSWAMNALSAAASM